MKKAFDQTVRDIKRGVNKKVLKVPSIEQKVLDATSNEPWGPHGSLLADIAQASRNYHEYQMIMSVIWKRINDTGKNWRHVYKALTILEYLVAHGTERIIDDVREHAYQISTLSDFQYIDSGGRDQGNNIRKKSQSLVVLVNDKERIQEVRQKAAANKDKFRSSPAGGMYRPGSGGYGDRYDDDRYDGRSGSRDDDRNGYGREREWGSRDDDRYGRYGESYGRDGDRYGRDNEEQFGRDGYRDDDYRGRSRSVDKYNYGSRSRSADRDRNPANEEDDQYSSRGSGAKADEHSQDGSGKKQESRYSGQSAPPSYEDALGATDSPAYNERDEESSQSYAPKASSPKDASPSHTTAAAPPPAPVQAAPQHFDQEVSGFDEFDPRGSFSAAPASATATATSNGIAHTTSSLEMDLLGSLAEPFSSNPLALVPANQPHAASEANTSAGFSSGPTAVAASPPPTINSQPFDDPFGDGPFRAITSPDAPNEQQIDTSSNSFTANTSQSLDGPQPVPQKAATEVGGNFYDTPDIPSGPFGMPPTTTTPFTQHESSTPNHEIDILADILPPSAPSSFHTQSGYPVPPNQPLPHGGFPPQTNQPAFHPSLNAHQNGFQAQTGQPGFPTQLGNPSLQSNYPPQPADSVSHAGFPPQTMALALPPQAGQAPQPGFHAQSGPTPMQQQQHPSQPHMNFYGAYQPQPASSAPVGGYMVPHSSTGLTSAAPAASQSFAGPVSATQASTGYAVAPKPSSDKFETKSTVWADTLSRGLVNLNISGSKTNPLADIGVDFDAINRREKRMEKQPPTSTAATSTVNMGKAMGSGSGIGRAGAGALRPQPNPMMGPGMNYGMPGGPGRGMGMNMAGMGGYGGSQPIGRGMGMGMGMGMNMPGSMGMGMNQGPNMQQPMGPPGSTMGYNPSMGGGNYNQQPYGGYR